LPLELTVKLREQAARIAAIARVSKKRTEFNNRRTANRAVSGEDTGAMKAITTSIRSNPKRIGLKKILVPVDLSPLSKKAFKYALRLAQQFGTELALLHVVEPTAPATFDGGAFVPSYIDEVPPKAEKELRKLINLAHNAEVPKARSLFCQGIASHEIVEEAKALNVDLIVMATHGYTGWKHFCIGSTAERVVRAAPCPVLVVRDKEREFI
jgi:universal stress protein A